jgi:hypothetical protein
LPFAAGCWPHATGAWHAQKIKAKMLIRFMTTSRG